MKYLFTCILFIISSYILNAQIGINTEKPFPNLSLHIDPRGNTTSNIATQSDDVVITQDGKMGIGTTTPNADLTINGSLKVNDNTQAIGKVLTARSDGTSYWERDSLTILKKQQLTLHMEMYSVLNNVNVVHTLIPTANYYSFINTIDGASFDNTTGVLSIPAGYYAISIAPNYMNGLQFLNIRALINNQIFSSNSTFSDSTGFNFLYTSSSVFNLRIDFFWTKPLNSIMADGRTTPNITMNICIIKIPLEK